MDEPFKLIPMVFTVAKTFDNEHSSADATKHAKDFVLWAWGVKHRKVSETRLEINQDDGETTNFCNKRHNTYISPSLLVVATRAPSDSDNTYVIRQLAESLAKSIEEAEKANLLRMKEFQLRKENEKKKRDCLTKLHSSFQNMVVNALASQSDRAAEKPDKRCQHFFNCETAELAGKDLNTMFETL
eukprot:14017727-Ditylum_brightwellii.AAC.1